jgi:hypothetical protein
VSIIVFVGPTVPVEICRQVLDATYLPSVSQGDVYRAALDRPRAIGIIDGFFERVPAVWHKEILWAMARGIHVFGAASMGALRAAELASFGMIGVGVIFEAFRDGRLHDDDEVTIVHGEAADGYPAGSVAMVDIRATLAAAEAAGIISPSTLTALVGIGKNLFYPERSYPNLMERARGRALPSAEVDALEAWLPEGRVSQKREDALAMLRVMSDWGARAEPPLSVGYHFEHTDVWEQVVNRSGRQLAAARPDFQSPQLLLEELGLDRDSYDRAVGGAFARALALAEAERHDIEVGMTLVNEAVTSIRRQHALVDPDALSRWIAHQELDLPEFGELLEQEAKIGWVRTMYGPDVMRCLPDWLRASGRYRAVADRARDKQRVLAAYGLEAPSLAEAPVDEAELLRWFFEEQRGTHVPARLDLHAYAVGFANRAAFLQAVLRDYYYVTLSHSA